MTLAMKLGPWSAGPGALHRKLADALAAAIERGDVAPGERLPAERVLARTLAVSRSTVVAAYDHLRAEGWLESRQGSGTRVRWTAPAGPRPVTPPDRSGDVIFRRLIEGPGGMISLAAAILPGSSAVADAGASFTREELADLIATTGYVPLGLPALRREIAALHTRLGLTTAPEQILVTTGAQQAISLIGSLLVRPGDTVLVENPSFSGTLDALRAAGARLLPIPVDDDGADVDALVRAVDAHDPAAVYLLPSYHNPTGAMLSESRRRRIAEVAADRGVPVIEDNALEHARLRPDPPPPPIAAFGRGLGPVLTVGSLSKVLWAGLRVGWIRADETTIGKLVQCKVVHDLGSPVIPQAVSARILPHLDQVERERREELREHLTRAVALLTRHVPEWTWRLPEGGLALWVRLPAGDGTEFGQVALRHGVEVVPGATMSCDGSFADHLRLALIEPPMLDEGIARLGEAWQAYAPSLPAGGRAAQPRVIV
jgi:DNA-binding transcriptional MocR family regulator